jgi:hypothetical protein
MNPDMSCPSVTSQYSTFLNGTEKKRRQTGQVNLKRRLACSTFFKLSRTAGMITSAKQSSLSQRIHAADWAIAIPILSMHDSATKSEEVNRGASRIEAKDALSVLAKDVTTVTVVW